ncbi:MAG TPA: Hpt domain-containing protein [Planctomycetota bacterium]|nr:Hpt domain-containing protein [Planctomycetota bacterium]
MNHPDSRPVLDLEVVDSLRALDDEGGPSLFLELIDLFVEDAAAQLQSMQSALAAGDVKTIERAAHTLKSSSANIGASRMSGICFEIERLGRAGSLDGVDSLIASTGAAYAEVRKVLVEMRS